MKTASATGRYNTTSNRLANRPSRPFDTQRQIYKVKLTFVDEEFEGEGVTLQLAKHNAASKALEYFSKSENYLRAKLIAETSQNKTFKSI